MRILLVSANTCAVPYPVYPLGLDYVAGSIGEDHDVTILDMNIIGPESLGRRVKEFSPELIGLSIRNIDNTEASSPEGFIGGYRQIMETLHKNSSAPIVLGGSGFTIFPRRLMKELGAEYGVVGEGERMSLLVKTLGNGGDTDALPGIMRGEKGSGTPAPWDGPVLRRFDGSSPHVQFYLRNGGMLNLQTKRGCRFNCIYCTYPHIEGREPRLFPADEAADTALRLEKAGAKYFFVTDAVFNGDSSHAAAVAEAFIRKRVSIPWGAYFAPTRPEPGFFELMKRAGMTHVEFGTESLSDRMLGSYGKPFTLSDAAEAHKSAAGAGLHVSHFLLLGGPGESRDTVLETLSNAENLQRTVLFFFCGVRIYPHTRLYGIALADGQISESDGLLEPVFYQSRQIGNDDMLRMVHERAGERKNWVFGAGGGEITRILTRMYRRGRTGPLWEHLIQ